MKPLNLMEDQGSDLSALRYITVKQHRSFEYSDLTFIVTFPGAVPYPNRGQEKGRIWDRRRKQEIALAPERNQKKTSSLPESQVVRVEAQQQIHNLTV